MIIINLPKEYKEGLIKYKPGLDIEPSWPEMMHKGMTFDEYKKLMQLYSIESMKYSLKEAIENKEITDDDTKEATDLIDNAIKTYNNM